ncbi:MAG: hypothetical protein AB9842_01995 [Bacteroidales bacterium]
MDPVRVGGPCQGGWTLSGWVDPVRVMDPVRVVDPVRVGGPCQGGWTLSGWVDPVRVQSIKKGALL